jgi:hypothetical protein
MKSSIINILVILTFVACVTDDQLEIIPIDQEIPEELFIGEPTGLKLESSVLTEEVRINAKLPADGHYRIKIRHGLNDQLISQERLYAKEGDNLLKVYVRTIETSSYKLVLTTDNHQVIGITGFAKI